MKLSSWRSISIIAIIPFLIALTLTACGGDQNQPTQIEPDSSFNQTSSEPTEDQTGGTEFQEAELPEDFPLNFPLPEDARIGSVVNLPGEGSYRIYISLPSSLSEAQDYYQTNLPDNNWIITEEGISTAGPSLAFSGQDFEGELIFIEAETGVGIDLALYPLGSAQEMPDVPINLGESTELGEGGGDFPEDFPISAQFNPLELTPRLMDQGYQLAFIYQGPPELALVELSTVLALEDWVIGDFTFEPANLSYLVPFSDPEGSFQGYALITNNSDLTGLEGSDAVIAFQSGPLE
jgi:hypothetical protein